MKLGIITDVHEHVEHLANALATFEHIDVDQVVLLGDILLLGEKTDQTCKLLADKNVVGVWGNHDFDFCVDHEAAVQEGFGPTAVDFLASLRPIWRSTDATSAMSSLGSTPTILSISGTLKDHQILMRR